MTENQPLPESPDEWTDRLTAAALREAIGNEAPPDLSAQIVARAAEPIASINANFGERRTTPLRMAIAASLVVACGALAFRGSDGEEFIVAKAKKMVVAGKQHQASNETAAERKRFVLGAGVNGDAGVVDELGTAFRGAGQRVAAGVVDGVDTADDRPFRQGSFATNQFDLHQSSEQLKSGPVGIREGFLDFGGWLPRADGGGRFPERQGSGNAGDQYARIYDNPFVEARGEQALSTFSIDVDTASYANVRKFLNAGRLPPADAVRIEELVNYFGYRYAGPCEVPLPPEGEGLWEGATGGEGVEPTGNRSKGGDARVEAAAGRTPSPNPSPRGGGESAHPFAAHLEVTGCPWKPEHRLVRIGVKGREMAVDKRPLTNLVFLVDVSGSMNQADKLPLVVEGLKKLTEQLSEKDRVAIVVYASQEGLALESTPGDRKDEILSALGRLTAGGSTAGGAGITLAYQIAEDHFIEGGANRVILCTDGDFNVGTTSTAELERLVAEKAKDTGVFLSVCGFGRGNLNDAMMETITNKGNGNYFYVDGEQEAEKVFVEGLTGTLVTIAKDVKVQVEFNPAKVAGYRLLGYENRRLANQDFNDDKKDAGEIGAGHTVTALYEVVPAGQPVGTPPVDELKYQPTTASPRDARSKPKTVSPASDELLTLKMRYKQPDGDVSTKLEWTVVDDGKQFADASSDTRFAAAVAGFGMLLRGSEHAGTATFAQIEEMALGALYDKESDPNGYRREFVELVRKAKSLSVSD